MRRKHIFRNTRGFQSRNLAKSSINISLKRSPCSDLLLTYATPLTFTPIHILVINWAIIREISIRKADLVSFIWQGRCWIVLDSSIFILPMTGFKPQTSGIGGDSSTYWATTTAQLWLVQTNCFANGCRLCYLSYAESSAAGYCENVQLKIHFVVIRKLLFGISSP